MLTIDLFEEHEGPPEPTLIDALRDFLPIAVKHLKIKELPKIKLLGDVETDHMPSFGKFSNDDRTVHLGIKNRHPNDILRTLAHELTHYAQGEQDRLDADSWHTGSTEEDEANAEAGVIMRKFNQQFPQYMALKPIVFEEWSKKYKKSINCSNPKGFSQQAHCAGRKKNTNVAEGWKTGATLGGIAGGIAGGPAGAVVGAGAGAIAGHLMKGKDPKTISGYSENLTDTTSYVLDHLPKTSYGELIMSARPQEMGISNNKFDTIIKNKLIPEFFIKKYGEEKGPYYLDKNPKLAKALYLEIQGLIRYIIPITITSKKFRDHKLELIKTHLGDDPKYLKYFGISQYDDWEDKQGVAENFADGKNPQDKGDSQRHGIPKGATLAQLEKAAKAPGRKGQLARWQINMRRGKKK